MANEKTTHPILPIIIKGVDVLGVTPITLSLDTVADFTVYDTPDDSLVAIVGLVIQTSSPLYSFTVKSGATTLVNLNKVGTNVVGVPLFLPIGKIYLSTLVKGEDLVFSLVSGAVASILVYVAEYSQIHR